MTTQQSQDMWEELDREAYDHPPVIGVPQDLTDEDWRLGAE